MTIIIALTMSATTAYAFTSGSQSQALQVSPQRGVLFQASTYGALQAGDYDGTTTLKDLRAHGDFGVGTFDALDGEMVLLNGTFYQVKSDGNVYVANDSMRTPFADVTSFEPDSQLVLASNSPLNYSELQQYLDGQLPTKNIFYAVKITGECSYLEVRSPPRQVMPYPPLSDALKNQSIFELRNVTGTFVGFFSPQYSKGICVPGWHFHFLTADKNRGGHVLDVMLQRAAIQIDDLTTLSVALPNATSFYALNLTNDT
ncbi:MAG TPA: acetolactate decarboxylase [Candidatus Bathyarchaeia archaeon]|nr:acetolactate decarboxylase [Candidatus Bathyarchaeia archaeon]